MITSQLVTWTCEPKQILVERSDVLHLICHFLERVIKEISWTMFTKFLFHCYLSSLIITTGNAVLQLEVKIPRPMTIPFALCWERPAVIWVWKKYLLQVWIQQPSSLKPGKRIHVVMWKCRMKMTPMAWFCRPREAQQILTTKSCRAFSCHPGSLINDQLHCRWAVLPAAM